MNRRRGLASATVANSEGRGRGRGRGRGQNRRRSAQAQAQAPGGERGPHVAQPVAPPFAPPLPYRLIRLHIRPTRPDRPASPALFQPCAISSSRDSNTISASIQQPQQQQTGRLFRRLGLSLLDMIGMRLVRVHRRRRGGGVWFCSDNVDQGQRTVAVVVIGALR